MDQIINLSLKIILGAHELSSCQLIALSPWIYTARELLWAHCYAQLMISPLIDHLTCHLCFYWFSILMHLQEESSCAPPPPECKDQAFAPERSPRDEVSLLVIQISWFLHLVLRGFSPFLIKSFCYSWICCMRRRSTPWSIALGVPSPEYVTNEGDIFNYLQKVQICCFLNKLHCAWLKRSYIPPCFVPLVLQIHQDLN